MDARAEAAPVAAGAGAGSAPEGGSSPSEAAPPPSTLRENVEAIIVAFVLALLIRQYAVEAFVIPTGSMAPTLLGAHVDVTCPNCGRGQPFGVHIDGGTIGSPAPNARGKCGRCNLEQSFLLNDDELTHAEVERPCARCQATVMARPAPGHAGDRELSTSCPNCGIDWKPVVGGAKWPSGDLSRGDRILVDKISYHVAAPRRYEVAVFKFPQNPTENYIKRLIGLPGETVDIRDGDVIVDGKVARKPEPLQEQLWRPIHESRLREKDEGGGPDGRRKAWRQDGGTWSRVADGEGWRGEPAAGKPAWLVYDRPVRDENTYNEGRPGQGGPVAGDRAVGDVRIRARVKPLAPGARLLARITVDDQPLELETGGGTVLAFRWRKQDVPLSRAAPATKGPLEEREYDIWRYDGVILLKVDGETIARLEMDDRSREKETRSVEVRIGVAGGAAEIHDIGVMKDVHYLARAGGSSRQRFPFRVPEGQYFFMGDNSPSSRDGREWGTVPASHLVGRAFLVFWPAVPGDLAVRRIR